ncbi:MAG TPA: hypothetical protein ENK65_00260 [Helicobacteraceae bacterium]|nr:hypothetical protein [Helicobacteraceae bacterium]
MLKISDDIKNLDDANIADNLLYYEYNTKHLRQLEKQGLARDDERFLSAYRSFEGEVFENYLYEKLIRYVMDIDEVTEFIAKGPHKKSGKTLPNTLSVNSKGQIVYRTNRNEIGEFDAIFFTKKELYFVEMTLVKSVTNLKRRLRKKKALLQTIFPQYTIKSLIILNEGVSGARQLPDYASVWITKPYSSAKVYDQITKNDYKRKPFEKIEGKKIIGTEVLKLHYFKYYNTLAWILKQSRGHKDRVLDMSFLKRKDVVRFVNLFTKFYIGFMDKEDFIKMYPSLKDKITQNVMVAVEKEHTGRLQLTYFMQHTRRNLDNIIVTGDAPKIAKKDPYGITVTEVAHIYKIIKPYHQLKIKDINIINKLFASADIQE